MVKKKDNTKLFLFNVTEQQDKMIETRSTKEGITRSKLFRKAVDDYLKSNNS